MRVRVSSSQMATSISNATSIMKARSAGNGCTNSTGRAAQLLAVQHPSTKRKPSPAALHQVKAGPCSSAGG